MTNWITRVAHWQTASKTRRNIGELAALPDHVLRDIGIDRDNVASFARNSRSYRQS
jgi:uncharacterized protein YjiS (DUF1127 family)